MTTPEDAKSLVVDATATFPAIAGAPTDDDVKRIREFLTNLLQSIDIAGGNDSLSGLIDEPMAYHREFGHNFDRLETSLVAYDPSIAADASNAIRVRAERAWTAKLERQRLIRTVERQLRIFFATIIEETWLLPLKDPATFFNKVPLRTFLEHLASSSGGLEATDIVHLHAAMRGWWAEDPRVPEYINRIEDAQKKAARANLPITNDWLAAIATMLLLAAGSFPKLRQDWDGRAPADKTWPAWKTWALQAQKTVEREQRASGNRGDVFGSASTAITVHGTSTTTYHPNRSAPLDDQLPTLSVLESHLDNMALAVTNEKAILDSLVASNATLTKLTADKLTRLEKLVLDLRPSNRGTHSIHPPPASVDSRAVFQLRGAIKHKWVQGGFCSTHGWGVSAGHTSADCKGKRPGHVDSATRTNPQGPGASKNKGWDDFLTS
jgi:hypothetical protein